MRVVLRVEDMRNKLETHAAKVRYAEVVVVGILEAFGIVVGFPCQFQKPYCSFIIQTPRIGDGGQTVEQEAKETCSGVT